MVKHFPPVSCPLLRLPARLPFPESSESMLLLKSPTTGILLTSPLFQLNSPFQLHLLLRPNTLPYISQSFPVFIYASLLRLLYTIRGARSPERPFRLWRRPAALAVPGPDKIARQRGLFCVIEIPKPHQGLEGENEVKPTGQIRSQVNIGFFNIHCIHCLVTFQNDVAGESATRLYIYPSSPIMDVLVLACHLILAILVLNYIVGVARSVEVVIPSILSALRATHSV
ncbi:hypothetical protein P152DRAFT_292334 [Eremomyces bilateralis CBS 781.70]|uniref:Uncharacterized protein n=1 Tax=Eremomyces bilateralis CBS 781.70 TaxID=1392243 RepID=A0A6G1G6Y5_9PEZI|nr:uncharacterized protein P152DRAFT_292334 [Eremomyces bilateralis CBS 781.70]KAF1813808.1 hypothetical protein P152DRAFT_292334 [Eremomyces bilateralis CBS 781.70]